MESKDTALYKVLAADYFQIPQVDILKFIRSPMRRRGAQARDLLLKFLVYFSSGKNDIKFDSPEKFSRAFEAISGF